MTGEPGGTIFMEKSIDLILFNSQDTQGVLSSIKLTNDPAMHKEFKASMCK